MLLSHLSQFLNKALKPLDIALIRRSRLAERFQEFGDQAPNEDIRERPLPAGAAEYLRRDHPQLLDYQMRYAGHPATQHSLWQPEQLAKDLTLTRFRADNAYIWQTREVEYDVVASHAFTTHYVEKIDTMGLLSHLNEDGLFGVATFEMDHGKIVSRDLLDSILEINFLERHLKISQQSSFSVLDIGAGYGRLAYRLAKTLPNLRIALCTDAVPESTFLCQYYTGFRGVSDKVKTVPLDRIEAMLNANPIDLVTNIHSFQECTIASISWWLKVLSTHRIKHFMLAHYRSELLSTEGDGTAQDFRPLIERLGFELVAKESVYKPGTLASKYGLYPDRWYYLFKNRLGVLS